MKYIIRTTNSSNQAESNFDQTEAAWISQRNAEAAAREERRERNRQAEAQYGLSAGDIIFA